MKNLILSLLFLPLTALADDISFSFIGISSHGIEVDESLMVRKISSTGYTVWNPELSLTYSNESDIFNATYLSDCFGNDAAFLAYGKYKDFSFAKLGIVGGLFVRKNLGFEVPEIFRHGKHDVILAPFFLIRKDLPMTDTVSLTFQMMTNYFLTHANVGITVDLFD